MEFENLFMEMEFEKLCMEIRLFQKIEKETILHKNPNIKYTDLIKIINKKTKEKFGDMENMLIKEIIYEKINTLK